MDLAMYYICNLKQFLEKLIGSTSGKDQLNAYWTNPPEDKNKGGHGLDIPEDMELIWFFGAN